jgi:hypothetical protein
MEERIPDKTIVFKCSSKEQKSTRILHIFSAEQWRGKYRVGKRNVHPAPPIREPEWWKNHYRLRLDGRWLNDSAVKYRFYSADQLGDLIKFLTCLQPKKG